MSADDLRKKAYQYGDIRDRYIEITDEIINSGRTNNEKIIAGVASLCSCLVLLVKASMPKENQEEALRVIGASLPKVYNETKDKEF